MEHGTSTFTFASDTVRTIRKTVCRQTTTHRCCWRMCTTWNLVCLGFVCVLQWCVFRAESSWYTQNTSICVYRVDVLYIVLLCLLTRRLSSIFHSMICVNQIHFGSNWCCRGSVSSHFIFIIILCRQKTTTAQNVFWLDLAHLSIYPIAPNIYVDSKSVPCSFPFTLTLSAIYLFEINVDSISSPHFWRYDWFALQFSTIFRLQFCAWTGVCMQSNQLFIVYVDWEHTMTDVAYVCERECDKREQNSRRMCAWLSTDTHTHKLKAFDFNAIMGAFNGIRYWFIHESNREWDLNKLCEKMEWNERPRLRIKIYMDFEWSDIIVNGFQIYYCLSSCGSSSPNSLTAFWIADTESIECIESRQWE